MNGIVKFFDSKKGFGFITRDDNGEDIFIHQSNIISNGFRSLDENDKVTFEIGEGRKGGPAAVNVKVVKALPKFLETEEISV